MKHKLTEMPVSLQSGDLCQCPHWGTVVKGSIRVTYADGSEEVVRAGEVLLLAARPHRCRRRRLRSHRIQPQRPHARSDRASEI
ncbi:MAG: hypothetical protein U5O39_10495 [Gammaproteobacteria bacterium]|nr:hypothetical protein [Gammaproteobacteria bacterium]